MYSKIRTILQNKDHLSLGVVFVCIGILLFLPVPNIPVATNEVDDTEVVVKDRTEVANPETLRIPRLGLEVAFSDELGLRTSGEVEVPEDFDSVGWYQYSPKPGELGPAVVLGHVDSYQGPAVFFSLGQLQVGDAIFITDENGVEREFVVESSDRYEQAAFPTELVYGDIDHAGLRLITCSGWYDRASDRYTHNRIIFARLKT